MKAITRHEQEKLCQNAQKTGTRLRFALERMNLQPELICRAYVVAQHGLVVAFYPLDLGYLEGKLAPYNRSLHQLSTTIQMPMAISNSKGFRYAVLLKKPKRLPNKINLEHVRSGKLKVGVSPSREIVSVPWAKTGHILTAGMTGYGKTNFIRSVVYQALRDEMKLLLGDRSATAFPMLVQHPGVLQLANSLDDYQDLVEQAHQIIGQRELLYRDCPVYPENVEEYNRWAVKNRTERLSRVLVVLDEYNNVAMRLGDRFSADVESIGNEGRKFGITLILAAQNFSKKILGDVRGQMGLTVVFKVKNVHLARNIGAEQAIKLSRPGLALTNRFGPLQTFYVPKQKLIDLGKQGSNTPLPLSEQELQLFARAIHEKAGKMSVEWVSHLVKNWSAYKVREKLSAWEQKGWIRKDPHRANARYVTDTVVQNFNKPENPTNV